MRTTWKIGLLVFAELWMLLSSASGQARTAPAKTPPTLFGRNLLVNGGIEADTDEPHDVPGWASSNGFTKAKYGSVSGEWDWGVPGCATCRDRYARLQFEGATHELVTSQKVDLAAAAEKIDEGKVTATISAYLGGFQNADTTSTIEASFRDASGKELGMLSTDPVDTTKLSKPEKGSAGLALCEKSGPVPAGTRQIVFTWHAKATGTSSDYLALGDNFSVVLTN